MAKRILREALGIAFVVLILYVVIAWTPFLGFGKLLAKLVWAAVCSVFVYFMYRHRRVTALKWPKAEAVIVGGQRLSHSTDKILIPALAKYGSVLSLDYSYEVLDEYYPGSFVLAQTCQTEEKAREQIKAWLDRKICVRYDPRKPHESMFLESDGAPIGTVSLGSRLPYSPGYISLSLR